MIWYDYWASRPFSKNPNASSGSERRAPKTETFTHTLLYTHSSSLLVFYTKPILTQEKLAPLDAK